MTWRMDRTRTPALLPLALYLIALGGPARADEAEDKALAMVERLGGQVLRYMDKPDKPVRQVTLLGKEVKDVKVEATYLGGARVYTRPVGG